MTELAVFAFEVGGGSKVDQCEESAPCPVPLNRSLGLRCDIVSAAGVIFSEMLTATSNGRKIPVCVALSCALIQCLFTPVALFGQGKPVIESSPGISIVVPENWSRIQVGTETSSDSFRVRSSDEPLMRFRKNGTYKIVPSMQANVIQQRWSLEDEAGYRAEILEALESRGVKIDQLTIEVRTSGSNKGHFVEYRAIYPNKPEAVKHAVFAIPGPASQAVLFAAVSLEKDFEELRADWDAPLGGVTIDWPQLPKKSPPRRGIGFGMAIGVLLGSVFWLLIRKRGQKK